MLNELYDELLLLQERMHGKSKRKFRDYLEIKAKECNLAYRIAPKSFASKNVVIGNLRNADFVIGAHYDTPPRMPSFLMRSVLFFNVMILLLIISLIILSIIFPFLIRFSVIFYYLFLFYTLGFLGMANKYNLNDNTSGVITLLYLMKVVKNPKVAYVFFDNEEKGLIGSLQLAALMKKSKGYGNHKKFIVLDCVGRGNVFGLSSFNKSDFPAEIIKAFNDLRNEDYKIELRKKSIFEMSDHLAFKAYKHVGIMCYEKHGKKYTLKNIHSHKDRDINLDNIEVLAKTIENYVRVGDFNG